jgi:hypothetical protein
METYGKILLIAMPAFLLLVIFEKWYGWKKGFETVKTMDAISSLASGVTNVTKDVLGLSIHHSSEEFNSVLRIKAKHFYFCKIICTLLLPAALLGIEPVVSIVAPLHLFAQFWYIHSINKMGFRKISSYSFASPCAHAINPNI